MRRMLAALAVLVAVGCDSGDEGDVVLIRKAEGTSNSCLAGVRCFDDALEETGDSQLAWAACIERRRLLTGEDVIADFADGAELGSAGQGNLCEASSPWIDDATPILWTEDACGFIEECTEEWDDEAICIFAFDPAGRC